MACLTAACEGELDSLSLWTSRLLECVGHAGEGSGSDGESFSVHSLTVQRATVAASHVSLLLDKHLEVTCTTESAPLESIASEALEGCVGLVTLLRGALADNDSICQRDSGKDDRYRLVCVTCNLVWCLLRLHFPWCSICRHLSLIESLSQGSKEKCVVAPTTRGLRITSLTAVHFVYVMAGLLSVKVSGPLLLCSPSVSATREPNHVTTTVPGDWDTVPAPSCHTRCECGDGFELVLEAHDLLTTAETVWKDVLITAEAVALALSATQLKSLSHGKSLREEACLSWLHVALGGCAERQLQEAVEAPGGGVERRLEEASGEPELAAPSVRLASRELQWWLLHVLRRFAGVVASSMEGNPGGRPEQAVAAICPCPTPVLLETRFTMALLAAIVDTRFTEAALWMAYSRSLRLGISSQDTAAPYTSFDGGRTCSTAVIRTPMGSLSPCVVDETDLDDFIGDAASLAAVYVIPQLEKHVRNASGSTAGESAVGGLSAAEARVYLDVLTRLAQCTSWPSPPLCAPTEVPYDFASGGDRKMAEEWYPIAETPQWPAKLVSGWSELSCMPTISHCFSTGAVEDSSFSLGQGHHRNPCGEPYRRLRTVTLEADGDFATLPFSRNQGGPMEHLWQSSPGWHPFPELVLAFLARDVQHCDPPPLSHGDQSVVPFAEAQKLLHALRCHFDARRLEFQQRQHNAACAIARLREAVRASQRDVDLLRRVISVVRENASAVPSDDATGLLDCGGLEHGRRLSLLLQLRGLRALITRDE